MLRIRNIESTIPQLSIRLYSSGCKRVVSEENVEIISMSLPSRRKIVGRKEIHMIHCRGWMQKEFPSHTIAMRFFLMTKWKFGFVNSHAWDAPNVPLHPSSTYRMVDFSVIIAISWVLGKLIQFWRRVKQIPEKLARMVLLMEREYLQLILVCNSYRVAWLRVVLYVRQNLPISQDSTVYLFWQCPCKISSW